MSQSMRCIPRWFIVQRKRQISGRKDETPTERFLRLSKLCRTRDLKQLAVLGQLVKCISGLIHALQKERGASAIFLGSGGAQFSERLSARVTECGELEKIVREQLQQVDEKLDRMSLGARFYQRVGITFRALDSLHDTREQVTSLGVTPQDAVKAFTEIIGCLLAVGFVVADIAADPAVSRALLALVNFAQGKEYAGQERATAGGPFSRGRFHAIDQRRLQHLMAAQEKAFGIFAEFAEPPHVTAFEALLASGDSAQVERLRQIALADNGGEPASAAADVWFEYTTRRIDAMKVIEDRMAADLTELCTRKVAEAAHESAGFEANSIDAMTATAPVAMLVMDVDPAANQLGLEGGIGLYTLDSGLPNPMHSILDVVQAQSRHIDAVSSQLESARIALAGRKVIEQAKGLLIKSRGLSESEAYALLRRTAMNQNRRLIEIAESIVGLADILEP